MTSTPILNTGMNVSHGGPSEFKNEFIKNYSQPLQTPIPVKVDFSKMKVGDRSRSRSPCN